MIVKAGVVTNGRHDRWLTEYAAELLAASIGAGAAEMPERGETRAGSLRETSPTPSPASMPDIDPARPVH
jgi:hypothetical protein